MTPDITLIRLYRLYGNSFLHIKQVIFRFTVWLSLTEENMHQVYHQVKYDMYTSKFNVVVKKKYIFTCSLENMALVAICNFHGILVRIWRADFSECQREQKFEFSLRPSVTCCYRYINASNFVLCVKKRLASFKCILKVGKVCTTDLELWVQFMTPIYSKGLLRSRSKFL